MRRLVLSVVLLLTAAARADPDACKLLSRDEAARFVGLELDDGVASTDFGHAKCRFKGNRSVEIGLSEHGAEALETNLKSKIFGAKPVEIPGVGRRALRSADSLVLGVLANGKLAFVMAAS